MSKNDWLRKRGTMDVFVRTKVLAERDDMYPISEEEALKCREAVEAGQKAKGAQENDVSHKEPKEAPAESFPNAIMKMDEEALRKFADKRKIFLSAEMPVVQIRRKIKAVLEKDEKSSGADPKPSRPQEKER